MEHSSKKAFPAEFSRTVESQKVIINSDALKDLVDAFGDLYLEQAQAATIIDECRD